MMKNILSFLTAVSALMFLSTANTFSSEEYCEKELQSMANKLAILVNEARAENGAAPLYVVPYLNEISNIRVSEILEDFERSAGGNKFTSYIDVDIVDYLSVAENIARGYETADIVFQKWINSDRHRRNMLDPNMTHIGISVAYDSKNEYVWYWEQLFVETDQSFEDQYLPADYEIVPKADGDINGDGAVDAFDYLVLCEYIYKKKNNIPVYLNEAQLKAADCFRDGIITESDAKVMVRYLLGEYKKLPFSF